MKKVLISLFLVLISICLAAKSADSKELACEKIKEDYQKTYLTLEKIAKKEKQLCRKDTDCEEIYSLGSCSCGAGFVIRQLLKTKSEIAAFKASVGKMVKNCSRHIDNFCDCVAPDFKISCKDFTCSRESL